MDTNTNATVTTHADLECQWTKQHQPTFVPPHPEHAGGMAHFDSGVVMISCATTASYQHPANSTVGAYPSMNEVSYHQLPQLSGS